MRYIYLLFKILWCSALFIPALILALIGIVFAPVICLFCDQEGYLSWWLRWFEPVDTLHGCYDLAWANEHPDWTMYKICWTFIQRNPAYGAMATIFGNKGVNVKAYGNPLISDTGGIAGAYILIADNGVFQFKAVWHIGSVAIIHEFGWQIHDPSHPTFGSYELAPIRFYSFGK